MWMKNLKFFRFHIFNKMSPLGIDPETSDIMIMSTSIETKKAEKMLIRQLWMTNLRLLCIRILLKVFLLGAREARYELSFGVLR